jgi:hypothetical protein
MMQHPARLIAAGFGLLLIGAALPFIMIFNLLPSILLLNLACVFAQVGGVALGLLGITHYGQYGRNRK